MTREAQHLKSRHTVQVVAKGNSKTQLYTPFSMMKSNQWLFSTHRIQSVFSYPSSPKPSSSGLACFFSSTLKPSTPIKLVTVAPSLTCLCSWHHYHSTSFSHTLFSSLGPVFSNCPFLHVIFPISSCTSDIILVVLSIPRKGMLIVLTSVCCSCSKIRQSQTIHVSSVGFYTQTS